MSFTQDVIINSSHTATQHNFSIDNYFLLLLFCKTKCHSTQKVKCVFISRLYKARKPKGWKKKGALRIWKGRRGQMFVLLQSLQKHLQYSVVNVLLYTFNMHGIIQLLHYNTLVHCSTWCICLEKAAKYFMEIEWTHFWYPVFTSNIYHFKEI